MRLDFSKLTQKQQKPLGTLGTLGTSPVYKAFSRPHVEKALGTTGDKLQNDNEFVPNVPSLEKQWGQRKPAPVLVVPNVPSVPTKKQCFALAHDDDLIREFMEVDGLTLEEAQAMAKISIKPRSSDEWLVLITELDQAIEAYCLAAGLSADALSELLAVRNCQSLASIPESLAWFKREWQALQPKPSKTSPAAPAERLMPYSSRESAKAAQRRLMQGSAPSAQSMQMNTERGRP